MADEYSEATIRAIVETFEDTSGLSGDEVLDVTAALAMSAFAKLSDSGDPRSFSEFTNALFARIAMHGVDLVGDVEKGS